MNMLSEVLELVKTVPAGRVTTYGEIGRVLGINPRQVGRWLHQNPDPGLYPCHRVVRGDGTIASGYAFGGREIQITKLREEGIKFQDDKIFKLDKLIFLF